MKCIPFNRSITLFPSFISRIHSKFHALVKTVQRHSTQTAPSIHFLHSRSSIFIYFCSCNSSIISIEMLSYPICNFFGGVVWLPLWTLIRLNVLLLKFHNSIVFAKKCTQSSIEFSIKPDVNIIKKNCMTYMVCVMLT